MKPVIVALLAVAVTEVGRGGPTERAILAAMKLSEQPSYSWTSTVVDDARTYEIEGKTMRGSCTWVRLPMVVSLARRLGPRAGTQVEALFRGNERCVIHTTRGWQALRELPRESRDWTDEDEWRYSRPGSSSRWSLTSTGDGGDPFSRMLQPDGDADNVPCTTAQFGVSHPHEELAVIVSCHTSVSGDGEVVTGTVSDLGAQLLLVRDGQEDIKPVVAAGTFQLKIQNGAVVAYALRLEGILEFEGRRVHVHQVSHTTLKDVGKTSFEPPDEARCKLGLN